MNAHNQTYFYNLLINIDDETVVQQNALGSQTGYPTVADEDYGATMQIVMSNDVIIDYFINELNMDTSQLSNVVCVPSSPLKDYLILLLADEITNIQFLFDNYRLAIIFCFDITYTIDNVYINQIPFLSLINLDGTDIDNNVIKIWKCDDPNMNIDCFQFKKYNPEWIWGNFISKYTYNHDIKLNDVNKCKKEQLKGKAIRRPKGFMKSIDGKGLFNIENNIIQWQEWKFHEQLNINYGPILNDIRFNDRSIVYSLFLSDMYVPYHDLNNIQWYQKAYMDGSHYGAAVFSTVNLTKNVQECPQEAVFLTQYIITGSGEVVESDPYACVFERFSDEIRVRHVDGINEFTATAPNIELVYRSVFTIGNYDYILDYIFQLDGTIRVNIAATGFNQVSQIDKNSANTQQLKYCNLLSENYCSVLHDHFFAFRVDMDVDETANNFYKGNLELETRDLYSIGANQFRYQNSYYYNENKILNEKDSISTKNPQTPTSWVFRSISNKYYNKGVQTQSGYEIIPKQQVIAFWDTETDIRDNNAMWIKNGLYVTKYKEGELYASGKYTWQSNSLNGIYEYVNDNDSIQDEDLIAWVTLGFHHLTRSEDMPVLPKHSNSFIITPFNFFEYTPAVCGDDIY